MDHEGNNEKSREKVLIAIYYFLQNSCNWVSSSDYLDTPQQSYFEEEDIPRVSAGIILASYFASITITTKTILQVLQNTWKRHGVPLNLSLDFLLKSNTKPFQKHYSVSKKKKFYYYYD